MKPAKEAVLCDCDNTMGLLFKEIDDGLMLLYLLGRPDVELLGVTTTFGNGTIRQVYAQTAQLLRDVGRTDIPLFKGARRRGQRPTGAARFLAEMAASRPGEITLLATGPLGNLRAAAEFDPDFFGNLRQIVCMGGYLRSLRIGWCDLPEQNLSLDPEAGFAVLNAPCPVTLMNAQICLQAAFGFRDLGRLRFWGRNTRRVVRNWLLAFGLYCGVGRFYLWDLVPAVYVSHPELFEARPVSVRSTVADLESGSLVVADEGEGAPVNMPTRILDTARFKEILFEAWSRIRLG